MIWASGYSTPMKAIFGPMKLDGITMSMIACENGMGRALTVWAGFAHLLYAHPCVANLCAVLRWLCAVPHCLCATFPCHSGIGSGEALARIEPQPESCPGQPWTLLQPTEAREWSP